MSAPGGMSAWRFTATPPSVAPYASMTSSPKRRAKPSTTSGDPCTRDLLISASTCDASCLHVPVTQLNTDPSFGGECHLDANMVRSAIPSLPLQEIDLLIVENVGN